MKYPLSLLIVKLYDKWSNYLMIESYDKIPYNKGLSMSRNM